MDQTAARGRAVDCLRDYRHSSTATRFDQGRLYWRQHYRRLHLLAICGDSITACRGYSLYIVEYLLMCGPVSDVATVQIGRGFDTAPGFVGRIENDVLPFKPDVATLCFGMNDGGYRPFKPSIAQTYRENLTEAVHKLKAGGVRMIVIGSPGIVDPAKFRKLAAGVYNEVLAQLTDAAREVAGTEGVSFADLHTPMLQAMTAAKARFGADYIIAPDGIHPYPNGHLVMAYAFLKALGFDGHIGTLTVDYTTGLASATR